jgi:hypothetical protein
MTAILAFLRLNWKPLVLLVIALAIYFALRHYGDSRYATGRSDEKAIWMTRLAAAEQARAVAEARTRTLETAADAITANAEARYAATVTDLNARAVDSDRRIHALSVRLAAHDFCRRELPALSRTAAESDAATASDTRANRAGAGISDTGRRCESDAATLAGLQQWLREQATLK